jgi:hypothetical protein
MLLQTNSYVVPRDKRAEHARVLRRFRQALIRLGCDHFEVFEQVGTNWSTADTSGRFVQIMRFRDHKHQNYVQAAERNDPTCQALLREFCELINVPYQQQQGLFAVGFYTSFLRMPPQPQVSAESPSQVQGDEDHHNEHAEAPAPTGILSMATPPEDIVPAAIPEIESRTEDESGSEPVSEDRDPDDDSNAIDLNAESPESLLPDDSPDSIAHDAFAMFPESDEPQSSESAHDASDNSHEADNDAELESDADAENRSTPFNS